jgi:hypothetical protein
MVLHKAELRIYSHIRIKEFYSDKPYFSHIENYIPKLMYSTPNSNKHMA